MQLKQTHGIIIPPKLTQPEFVKFFTNSVFQQDDGGGQKKVSSPEGIRNASIFSKKMRDCG
jgi:hypothetical protein